METITEPVRVVKGDFSYTYKDGPWLVQVEIKRISEHYYAVQFHKVYDDKSEVYLSVLNEMDLAKLLNIDLPLMESYKF